MDDLQRLAAQAALRKMVTKGWVDICTIDAIARSAGIVPPAREHGILHLLHCVHFKEMDPELRAQLPGLVEACLSGERFDLTLPTVGGDGSVVMIEEQPRRRRLLGVWPVS